MFVGLIVWRNANQTDSPAGRSGSSEPSRQEIFDKQQHSTDRANSLWTVVNKGRKLPSGYFPNDLTSPSVPLRFAAGSPEMKLQPEASQAIERLFAEAKSQDLQLLLVSGYRSYSSQAAIYDRNVKQDGLAKADATSARAGHSEHQTGLAADVGTRSRTCELDKCFGTIAEGKWLAINAHKFGFIIRYQDGKREQTGYDYEPWHLRYVGVELAVEINRSSQTLEQFFGLPANSSYPKTPQTLIL